MWQEKNPTRKHRTTIFHHFPLRPHTKKNRHAALEQHSRLPSLLLCRSWNRAFSSPRIATPHNSRRFIQHSFFVLLFIQSRTLALAHPYTRTRRPCVTRTGMSGEIRVPDALNLVNFSVLIVFVVVSEWECLCLSLWSVLGCSLFCVRVRDRQNSDRQLIVWSLHCFACSVTCDWCVTLCQCVRVRCAGGLSPFLLSLFFASLTFVSLCVLVFADIVCSCLSVRVRVTACVRVRVCSVWLAAKIRVRPHFCFAFCTSSFSMRMIPQ